MPVISGSDAKKAAALAAAVLQNPGAVVLLPTETVYGLVCRASDEAAKEKIYRLKHRSGNKVLGCFVADYRKISAAGADLSGLAGELAAKYTPGPITIIAPRTGGGTVGFRVPDHPLVLEILRLLDEPLSQTSANRSGMPNALNAGQALEMLDGEVDLAIDGGDIRPGALASTVVDATGETAKVLRQGALQIDPRFLKK